ncbi:MAG: lactate utilization protein [Deltaproteobacteria bacterium]|nr:lactate utilization protein [Deltaproteobacteria bacterium]
MRERPHALLFPPAPYTMGARIAQALGADDAPPTHVRRFVPATTRLKDETRVATLGRVFGARVDELRRTAGAIKDHVLATLDQQLATFAAAAAARGVRVHAAADAAEARAVVLAIARARNVKRVVKAKSMLSEEVQLLDALLDAGIDTIETDLGELVLQLDDDAPSHLVTPMIHKDREAAAAAFARRLGVPHDSDPAVITKVARAHLRRWFESADMGVTGANFLVASTGEVVVCTNEGNGRLSANAPRVHVALAGIEKLVPTPDHLALFLELLARSSTGQPLTVYTTFCGGPREPGEPDGPDEVHVVLVDNGRTRVLADPTFRAALRCVRCGACLNACPVYRTIGGHAYGSVYPGPIGQVLTPLLRGLDASPDLPFASTLCGACRPACPVDIDLPAMLVALRARRPRRRGFLRLWAFLARGRFRWRLAAWLQRRLRPSLGWDVPGRRTLPRPAPRPFHATWRRILKRRTG